MKKLIEIIKNHRKQSALSRLHKLCVLGTSDKKVPGFENISFQTWVELMGIYTMFTYTQQLPSMSADAMTVITKVGLDLI